MNNNQKYYDGTKLLSMKDIRGEKPEIFMCTTNRTGGKTTFFTRMFIKKFKERGEKFAMLYRFNYELDDCADKIFKDVGRLFFPNDIMTNKKRASGIYHELFLNEIPCGYALTMNNADGIKKNSHLFSDVVRIMFDEFQSESSHYCDNELTKFQSVHTSIARGNGEQTRYVPVIMLSNPVSIINPYYVELGISERLRQDTKFLRGDGYVLEQGYVKSASDAQKQSGFNRAFSRSDYNAYSAECVYLNDNTAFIDKITGSNRYLATLKYQDRCYAIRQYDELGIVYCDDRPDMSYKFKITVTTQDHEINYVMLKSNDLFISNLRYYFERGCFRFKDLRCKEAVLKALTY